MSGAEWDVGLAPVEILNKSLHKKIISTSKLNILYSRKQLTERFEYNDNHNSVNHQNWKDFDFEPSAWPVPTLSVDPEELLLPLLTFFHVNVETLAKL